MHKVKDYFQKLYFSFPLENFLNIFVVCVIAAMIFLASLALSRPINSAQYQSIHQYSQQAALPKTQQLAQHLQQQEQISRAEYLRLLRAYHFEKQRIKEYPAVDIRDPQ